MLENPYLNIIISATVIYLFIIAGIRLFGKNELSQLSTPDLVFILLISNAVQNAMVGDDSSLGGGILAASTLFLVNKLFKTLLYKSERFKNLMEGEPAILIRHGKLNRKVMNQNKLTIDEIEESARESGKGDLTKIDLAILEVDGKISFLTDKDIKPGSKFDVDEKETEGEK